MTRSKLGFWEPVRRTTHSFIGTSKLFGAAPLASTENDNMNRVVTSFVILEQLAPAHKNSVTPIKPIILILQNLIQIRAIQAHEVLLESKPMKFC